MSHAHPPTIVSRLQEFSVPLIAGVMFALWMANTNEPMYHEWVHAPFFGLLGSHATAAHDATANQAGWMHYLSMHFLVNDLFMVLFFGLAAKEITEACLPGGALNPPSKACNPLLGTLGGVLGPVGVYFLLNAWFGNESWARGWGIPTATDIALAWLIARFVFGKGHPAISFLLLLAVADDAIGLGIIAVAYPNPQHQPVWLYTLGILPAMGLCWFLRQKNVRSWLPYIAFGGTISWLSLYTAHLHPALALVFIVPFLPPPQRDYGLFEDREASRKYRLSTLEQFEHDIKIYVDFGLFFFAFANAGVSFAEVNPLTWIVLTSLIVGKTVGITLFSAVGDRLGMKLPTGMSLRHLVVAGVVAGTGLTVALFVSGQAFHDGAVQGAAKMGALFSVAAAAFAFALGHLLGVTPRRAPLVDSIATALEQTADSVRGLTTQQRTTG